MTGFLQRLVERTIQSAPIAQTVEPRRRGRFEPSRPGVDGGGRWPETIEHHVDTAATPPPKRSQTSLEAPEPMAILDDGPAGARGSPTVSASPRAQLDRAGADQQARSGQLAAEPRLVPEPDGGRDPATVTERAGPLGPVVAPTVEPPVTNPSDRPAAPTPEAETPSGSRTERPEAAAALPVVTTEVVRQPTLEPVVEIRRVPGPPLIVERRVPTARRPPIPSTSDPATGGRTRLTVGAVRVEGGEPLATHGLNPLDRDDLIEHPGMAAAVDRAGSDAAIHVHIGRLEVQRAAPPSAPAPNRRPPAPVLGLAAYLDQRSSGRAGT